jgi:hypothetical protein
LNICININLYEFFKNIYTRILNKSSLLINLKFKNAYLSNSAIV